MSTILAATRAATKAAGAGTSVGVPAAFVFAALTAGVVKMRRNGDTASAVLGAATGFFVALSFAQQVLGFIHWVGQLLAGA